MCCSAEEVRAKFERYGRVRDVYLPRESRGGGGMQPRHVPACLRRRTYKKYEEVLVPAVKPAALPPGEVLVKVLQFRDT